MIGTGRMTEKKAEEKRHILTEASMMGAVKSTKEGREKVTYANGNFYDGDWKSARREGRGKLKYSDGNSYDGGGTIWNKEAADFSRTEPELADIIENKL